MCLLGFSGGLDSLTRQLQQDYLARKKTFFSIGLDAMPDVGKEG
jgi:hypothetical protein